MAVLTVRSKNLLQRPLLETDEAFIVEIRDAFGDLMALLVRIFAEDTWGLVTKGDPDWEITLIKYGYIKPGQTLNDLLRE
jgi:hypothetical protein